MQNLNFVNISPEFLVLNYHVLLYLFWKLNALFIFAAKHSIMLLP